MSLSRHIICHGWLTESGEQLRLTDGQADKHTQKLYIDDRCACFDNE